MTPQEADKLRERIDKWDKLNEEINYLEIALDRLECINPQMIEIHIPGPCGSEPQIKVTHPHSSKLLSEIQYHLRVRVNALVIERSNL